MALRNVRQRRRQKHCAVEIFRTGRAGLPRAYPGQGSRSVCLLSYHQAISSLLRPRQKRLVGQVISLPSRAVLQPQTPARLAA